MKLRLLSVLLVFLLVTSVSVPAVSAEPIAPVVVPVIAAVVPEVTGVVGEGITVFVGGATLVTIGEHLGIKWDGVAENFNNFVSDVGKKLSNIISGGKWVDVTSDEGKATIEAVYEYYTATSGDGGKKDDKWYFEARLNDKGKIEVNTKRMDETQAVKKMGQGKDIMTLSRELAQKAVGRFRELPKQATGKLKFETHHGGKEGYLPHLHYYVHGVRLHCWSWK